MDDHLAFLRFEADRLERSAADYRIVARTDSARRIPALKNARILTAKARHYRSRIEALATPSKEERDDD